MNHPLKTPAAWTSYVIGLVLLSAVGVMDYFTGYQITLVLFYLIPILFVLRRLGTIHAILMSVLATLVCWFTNVAAGESYTDRFIPIWNSVIRLAIFLLVVSLVAGRRELEKLVRQRTANLTSEVQERKRLEKELLEASEREQRRIGHDLHDSLGQHLTATALAGKVLAKKLADRSQPEAEAASHLVQMIEAGIELTRQLARSLHPIQMQPDGLAVDLQALAANISHGFHVACHFDCPHPVALPDPSANIHLFRITQEAISNAIRHGHAANITVSLKATNSLITLAVTDDGQGLPADAHAKSGMGLRLMNYRAGLIGATFAVQRLSARGTRISCTLPTAEKNHDAEA